MTSKWKKLGKNTKKLSFGYCSTDVSSIGETSVKNKSAHIHMSVKTRKLK